MAARRVQNPMDALYDRLHGLPVLRRLPPVAFRYLLNGSMIFGLNLLLAAAIFQLPLTTETALARNLTNAAITEVMILFAFAVHSGATWRGHSSRSFVARLLRFHLVSLSGLILRLSVFFVLDHVGLHWFFATVGSVVVVIAWNFFGYDRLVFGRKEEHA